ncbi:SDR family oxidoreductase [Conexibacter woesei]|uniref:Short-chain dehydrogenase/reductase SDR n=1 Tax=Conexibacter woesei (strain DSM 14684 / CCUG 47730 / CIP 108061 / JCM 11494 / NBRC 100937 / ID131577) TaxID=469383 RepID=D3F3R5_CONWI|nr:SDR family oxidoreductase [Conexibacter woesei]ADB52430.1 short-chain dehydrogenase/reductase SDR [Conexibacter woesei DSM 14684]
MSHSSDMSGRAAIVTGASRGIGQAIAAALLARGASVCITARKPGGLAEAAAALDAGERLLTVAGNSRDPGHRAEAIETTMARFGRLDVLVNNTGVNPAYDTLVETDLDAFAALLDVNVVGALGWVQQAHAAWMGEHGGAVVNVASAAGLRPARMIGAYGASKAAIVHMTAQLAAELGPRVRVNAVAPAVVRTRMAGPLYEGREQEVAAAYPLRRLGEPADIASAVAFLASDEASWVTGETLVVDGGLMTSGGVDG